MRPRRFRHNQESATPGYFWSLDPLLADEIIRKLLQLLKEAAPRLRSVALFVNPTNEAAGPLLKFIRADAPTLGLRLQIVEVAKPGDFEPGLDAILRESTESILLIPWIRSAQTAKHPEFDA